VQNPCTTFLVSQSQDNISYSTTVLISFFYRQGCVISFGTSVPEVPYARSSSRPSCFSFPFYLEPSTRALHYRLVHTALSRRGLPAWHPDEYESVTLTVACVRCSQGRKEIQACVCCDRTGNMFGHVSLIRHSHRPPPFQLTGPCWMHRKTHLWLLLGEDGVGSVAD